jgi:hypothetical protein
MSAGWRWRASRAPQRLEEAVDVGLVECGGSPPLATPSTRTAAGPDAGAAAASSANSHLGKSELRLKATSWQVALVVQLSCVGHPLVYEDQARSVFVEELSQHVAGACGLLVIRGKLCDPATAFGGANTGLFQGRGGRTGDIAIDDASATKPEFVGAQQRIDDAAIRRGSRVATEEDPAGGAKV